jgi:hypothetical protein
MEALSTIIVGVGNPGVTSVGCGLQQVCALTLNRTVRCGGDTSDGEVRWSGWWYGVEGRAVGGRRGIAQRRECERGSVVRWRESPSCIGERRWERGTGQRSLDEVIESVMWWCSLAGLFVSLLFSLGVCVCVCVTSHLLFASGPPSTAARHRQHRVRRLCPWSNAGDSRRRASWGWEGCRSVLWALSHVRNPHENGSGVMGMGSVWAAWA